MQNVDYALAYVARGWPVLPVRPRGKEPLAALAPHGAKDASNDPETIRAWWGAAPTANVGIAVPPGVVVLDIDPRNGGDATLAAFEQQHGPLPSSVECRTGGGGRHLYFRIPDGVRPRGKLGPGLDVKGVGGYAVAPPSVHPGGGKYAWRVAPDTTEVAAAPTWLLELLVGAEPKAAAPSPEGRIPQGDRNTTLTSLAGAMRRRGMSGKAIEAALLAENAARCEPPLAEGEVRRIAASVGRYAPADDGEDLQRDYGHAAVLATLFKDRYRWATHRGCWMAWTGAVWRPVPEEAVAKVAADELRRHYAAQLATATDKGVTEDDLVQAAGAAFQNGWHRLKLYFMIGLPGETDEDVAAIGELTREVQARFRRRITVHVTPFVPKPHTPFARLPMAPEDVLNGRSKLIAQSLRPAGVTVRTEGTAWARVQGVLARGDRAVGRALSRLGAPTLAGWRRMLREAGLDEAAYLGPGPPAEAVPWDTVEVCAVPASGRAVSQV